MPRPALRSERPPQHLADHRLRQFLTGTRPAPAPCRARAARGSRRAAPLRSPAGPGLRTTHAFATSPLTASGTPATPTSSTAGMCRNDLLDLPRPHLESARLDQILLAIDEEDVAVLVHVGQVAGVDPRSPSASRTQRLRGFDRVVPVLDHPLRRAHDQLADVSRGQFARPRCSASTIWTSTSGSGMPIEPILFGPFTGLTQHAIMPSVSE